MTCLQTTEKLSPFSYGIRAVAVIATTVAATVLGLMLSRPEYQSHAFFWRNVANTPARLALVIVPFACAGAAALVFGAVWAILARKRWNFTESLYRVALTCSPLAPIAFAPVFLDWSVWQDRDLTFLLMVLLEALALRSTLTAAARARLWELIGSDSESTESRAASRPWLRSTPQHAPRSCPHILVCCVDGTRMAFACTQFQPYPPGHCSGCLPSRTPCGKWRSRVDLDSRVLARTPILARSLSNKRLKLAARVGY